MPSEPSIATRHLPSILFVATPAALGGSNRSLITVLSGLEGRAHRVLAAPGSGTFAELVRDEGLVDEYVDLPRKPLHPMDRVLRLAAGFRIGWWALRNHKRLTAIHANALTGLNLAALGAILSRKPTVVWIHDPVGSRWGARLGPVLRRLLPHLRIAAVSATAERIAVENGLCDVGDAAIVPNPIDPAEILAPQRRDGQTPLHVGYVGGASIRKGFDLLPTVIDATMDLPILWKLYVYLEPQLENADVWKQLARFSRDRVDPVGKLSDVGRVYGDLDIVFIPSRAESFCRVAAEAMLNRLPVVGSDIEPLQALLGEDEAGLIFPNEDVDAAVAALRKVVAEPELRSRLGEAGAHRAARFSPAAITDELAKLYGIG